MKQKSTININDTNNFVNFEYSFFRYENIRETKNANDHLELRFDAENEELTFISKMKNIKIKNITANLGGEAYIYPVGMTYGEYVEATPKTYEIFYNAIRKETDNGKRIQKAIAQTIESYKTSVQYADVIFTGTFTYKSVVYTVELPLFES